MKRLFRIFVTGLGDGLQQPNELNVGMSYEDGTRGGDVRQYVYDKSSLLGQSMARLAFGRKK